MILVFQNLQRQEIIQRTMGQISLMSEDIVSFLRGDLNSLPVGPKEAIAAGLVAMAIDESMKTGQIVDMTQTWEELDSLY